MRRLDRPLAAPADSSTGASASASHQGVTLPVEEPATNRLMAAYPGPAVLIAVRGELGWPDSASVERTNDRARALLRKGHNFGRDLIAWISRVHEAGSPLDHPITTRLPAGGTGGGDAFIEWMPVPLHEDGVLVLGRDVTLDREMRTALATSRQRFKDLIEAAADFAWETDSNGVFTYITGDRVCHVDPDNLVGRPATDLLAPGIDRAVFDQVFCARSPISEVELWLSNPEGQTASVLVSARPVYDESGNWSGARGTGRDVTHQRRRDAEVARLRTRETVLLHIIRAARDEIDPEKVIRSVGENARHALSAAGCTIYGIDQSGELVALAEFGLEAPPLARSIIKRLSIEVPFTDLGDQDDPPQDQPPLGTRHGRRHQRGEDTPVGWAMAAITRSRGKVNGALLVWRRPEAPGWAHDDRDLLIQLADFLGVAQAQREYQDHLRALSATDVLTGLYNRRAFMERLEQRVRDRRRRRGALLYVDLDNFKAVNDTHGHSVGDTVLEELAAVLSDQTRYASDFAARLGGDEFALWIDGVDETRACKIAARILDQAEPLNARAASPEKALRPSIGIALRTSMMREEDPEGLLARADRAMYEAKRRAKAGDETRFIVAGLDGEEEDQASARDSAATPAAAGSEEAPSTHEGRP